MTSPTGAAPGAASCSCTVDYPIKRHGAEFYWVFGLNIMVPHPPLFWAKYNYAPVGSPNFYPYGDTFRIFYEMTHPHILPQILNLPHAS